ncbi:MULTISPECIES: DUF1800 family protein [unclassified Oceanobacter]|uniref:DUF1800 domain-containing protein n=1 Tax=unclassified Oceanobacter TaxID=2620260 RepID=UPI00273366CD|nr:MULTISPECIES: DUF1800 domain-containing protein [unclassified Oceanobacter]MDP2506842.1 DUF1800 domain-containing protein [Oceanobacter sp. 3_MG-2023]MDP2547849.1 DUF1800 domain-containing protein [Oceanobacter sp. 4_MG-2023]
MPVPIQLYCCAVLSVFQAQVTYVVQSRPSRPSVWLLATILSVLGSWVQAGEESVDRSAAIKLLQQASFGPSPDSIAAVMSKGIEDWVDEQLVLPQKYSQLQRTIQLALMEDPSRNWFETSSFNSQAIPRVRDFQQSAWWEQALTAKDQLRQRVAFALSQLVVVSINEPPLQVRAEALAAYNDLLLKYAFGNYRDLLSAVTYSPAMGIYLSYQGNRKSNPKTETSPDENYARELMQLFTIGLYNLNLDGSIKTDKQGNPIPVYTQTDVMELARVLTGWDLRGNKHYGGRNQRQILVVEPLEFTKKFHDFGSKILLGEPIEANLTGKADIERALDILFAHPNVGPFVSKHLIQRLVSSNPSPEYIGRVSTVFNDNGKGIRGDMAAMVRAILLDSEARDQTSEAMKLKEPVLALSAVLRMLDVQPAEPWESIHGGQMHDVIWFRDLGIGQNAYRSPSVFNFYSADYQPSEAGFVERQWVAPEAEILDVEALVAFSNILRHILLRNDKQSLAIRGEKYARNINKQRRRHHVNLLVDTGPWLKRLELALENDSNGDFLRLNSDNVARRRALDAVLDQLELPMLGKTMPEPARTRLIEYLMVPQQPKNPRLEALQIIEDSIRLLAAMPEYWTQN